MLERVLAATPVPVVTVYRSAVLPSDRKQPERLKLAVIHAVEQGKNFMDTNPSRGEGNKPGQRCRGARDG
ncbi:hypothetical protein RUM43_009041 [Polyplax serrata]|uniref:Uncharacterized protein n=1 Tax=Polyplax serrata TaxID=468196 RepID=A0AAN8PVU1_POLSC